MANAEYYFDIMEEDSNNGLNTFYWDEYSWGTQEFSYVEDDNS